MPFQFYKLNVYEGTSDEFSTENQITEQLLSILKDSGQNEPIGLLSTEHRDTLATAYENLTNGESKPNLAFTGKIVVTPYFSCFP